MKSKLLLISTIFLFSSIHLFSQRDDKGLDFENTPLPDNLQSFASWDLIPGLSDDFNHNNKNGTKFKDVWSQSYLPDPGFRGPGSTVWQGGSLVKINNGILEIRARPGSGGLVNCGIISSRRTIKYPVYMEAKIKVSNIRNSSNFWMLNKCDNEEIDVMECYGGDPDDFYSKQMSTNFHLWHRRGGQSHNGAQTNANCGGRDLTDFTYQTFFQTSKNDHWRNDFHTFGVYWASPTELEFYIDGVPRFDGQHFVEGRIAKSLNGSFSDAKMQCPNSRVLNCTTEELLKDVQGQIGGGVPYPNREFNDPTHIIIDTEAHAGRPVETVANLRNENKNVMTVDWVRVYRPSVATIPVTGISILPVNTTLNIGQTRSLSSTISPSDATNKKVLWSSSNTTIATVTNSGIVSAITSGTAIITGTSDDGSFTDTVSITVNDIDPSNPSINEIIIEAETFTSTNGTFDDSEFSGPGLGVIANSNVIEFVNSGDYAEYTINVVNAGDYTAAYLIATPSEDAEIQIAINGNIVTTDSVKNTGGWDNYSTLTSNNVIALNAGVQTVKITATGTGLWQWNLDKVTLKRKDNGASPSLIEGGILTGGPFIFVVGNGVPDNVSGVAVTGNLGTISKWVITDEALNILGLPATPGAVNFDDLGAGTYLIWNISSEAGLIGLEVGQNISNLKGTYDLSSNSVRVECKAFTTPNQNATLVIEAEDFDTTGGIFNDTQFGGSGLGVNKAAPRINYVNKGDWAEYTIDIAVAGTYTIDYSISTPSDNAQIEIVIDSTNTIATNVPNNGDWENFTSVLGGSIVLSQGSHLIRINATGDNIWQWNLDKITLSTGTSTSAKFINSTTLRLKVYPNPSSDTVSILGLNEKIDYEVHVYDITGSERKVTVDQNYSINIENLAAGIYFATVFSTIEGTKTVRFIKN